MTPELVETTLDDILGGPEFTEERTFWNEIWDWLSAHFEFGEVLGLADFFRGLLLAVLLAGTIAYVVLWIRTLRARRDVGSQEVGHATSALERARQLVRAGKTARARGDLQAALRLYLHAMLVGFSRKDGLAFRAAWTNRELLRRGQPSPEVREVLGSLVEEYESKEFGREAVRAQDLDRMEGLIASELVDLAHEETEGAA